MRKPANTAVRKKKNGIAFWKIPCYNTQCVQIWAYIGMSPSGKAPDFDSGIRRFKSCHPSHDPLAQLAEQLPFKQWVWSSNLQRVTKKADTPTGYLLFYVERRRFERLNAARTSAAADGWTEANLYFDPIPGVKMQTNLQRVTKKADTLTGYLLFYVERRRLERLNAARMSAATDGLTEVILYFHQR